MQAVARYVFLKSAFGGLGELDPLHDNGHSTGISQLLKGCYWWRAKSDTGGQQQTFAIQRSRAWLNKLSLRISAASNEWPLLCLEFRSDVWSDVPRCR